MCTTNFRQCIHLKVFFLSTCLISLPSMVISNFDASFWVLCLDPSVMHEVLIMFLHFVMFCPRLRIIAIGL